MFFRCTTLQKTCAGVKHQLIALENPGLITTGSNGPLK